MLLSASFYLAFELRFDFALMREAQQERMRLLGYVLAIKFLCLVLMRQMGSVMRYFSMPDLARLVAAMAPLERPRLVAVPAGVQTAAWLPESYTTCSRVISTVLAWRRASSAAVIPAMPAPRMTSLSILAVFADVSGAT